MGPYLPESPCGCDRQSEMIVALQEDVAELEESKQDTLREGANVAIVGNTISATDTKYSVATTARDGLMSSSDKVKLNGIQQGAETNVQSDWNQTSTSSDAYIKNKPTIPSAGVQAPNMDGIASVGTSTLYARQDHKHPTDTSRAAATHKHSASDITSGVLVPARGGTGKSSGFDWEFLGTVTGPSHSIQYALGTHREFIVVVTVPYMGSTFKYSTPIPTRTLSANDAIFAIGGSVQTVSASGVVGGSFKMNTTSFTSGLVSVGSTSDAQNTVWELYGR